MAKKSALEESKDLYARIRGGITSGIQNIKGNIQAIANPQTRQEYLAGITKPIQDFRFQAQQVGQQQAPQILQKPIATGFRVVNAIEQNPLARVPLSFGQGLIQGQNLGLGQRTINPITTPERAAYTTGSIIGSLNPKSLTGRAVGAVVGATSPVLNRVVQPVAGPITSRIASGLANVVQGTAINPLFGGRPITPQSAALDFISGAVAGPGQFKGISALDRGAVLQNPEAKIVATLSDKMDKLGNISIQETGKVLELGKKYLKIPQKKLAKMGTEQVLSELGGFFTKNQSYAYRQLPGMGFAGTKGSKILEEKMVVPEKKGLLQSLKSKTNAILSGQDVPKSSVIDQKMSIPAEVSSQTSIPQDPVQRIIQALKEAKPLRGEQEALYSAERAKRVARVAGVGSRVGGEKGYFAQLGQLKGALPKVQFESIRKQIDQPAIDSLFNTIEQKNIFSPFEKVTAKTGLAKLLGAEGGAVPTTGELKLLSEVFPPEFIQSIQQKRPLVQKLFEGAAQVLNLPRSLMASFDLSAPLRQGIFLVGRPKQWGPAFVNMFKYAGSEKSYQGLIENIQSRPTYKLMRENNLALTDMGSLTGREEAFMSNLAEKIPVLGKGVRASGRAYSGFLNKLRADTFDDILRGAKESGADMSPKFYADVAKFVNSATGRGDLGSLQKAAVVLNSTLFSPRLVASRINLMNPSYYMSLDPTVRKEALKSLLSFTSTGMTVLGLAKLAGAEVGVDPRSSDFGKIKVGNTRFDIWGGFQQYLVLASRLLTGQSVNSTTGKTYTYGEGYKPTTRFDALQRFFESKESPVVSFATGLLKGTDALGQPYNVKKELSSRFIPLVIQGMKDLYEEQGPSGLFMGVPSLFGVGTQTYGPLSNIKTDNPSPNDMKKIKNVAVDYYLKGDKNRAQDIKSKYNLSISQKDITDYQKKQKKDALDAYVRGDKEFAMKTKQEVGFTISQEDVQKSAKSYAIQLYKEGKKEEAMKLKQQYGFFITQKDLQ